MSRTDKTAPYRIRSRDAEMREEWHVWCDNETVNTAHPWKYGRFARRAQYEREYVKTIVRECHWVKMIDSNKVTFKARMTDNFRQKDGLVYDREEHPDAKPVLHAERYGGEVIYCREISRGTYEHHIYRSRLIGWIEEPIRECDIDKGNGICHYIGHGLRFPISNGRENRRIYDEKPRRQHARRTLKQAVADYNAYGETDIEPDPQWGSGSWW